MRRVDRARSFGLIFVLAAALGSAACSGDVDPDQALREGLTRQQAGDLEGAAERYQQVLDLRPDDQFANYNMGVIEQVGGRNDLAEAYYRAALDTAPSFVAALFNLAILRTEVGATQEAIDLYERAVASRPGYAAAHLNLGLLYQAADEAQLATQHLTTAVRLDPSLADRIVQDPIQAPAGSGSAHSEAAASATP